MNIQHRSHKKKSSYNNHWEKITNRCECERCGERKRNTKCINCMRLLLRTRFVLCAHAWRDEICKKKKKHSRETPYKTRKKSAKNPKRNNGEERMKKKSSTKQQKKRKKNMKHKSLKISTVYDSINNNCYSVHITAQQFSHFSRHFFHFSCFVLNTWICMATTLKHTNARTEHLGGVCTRKYRERVNEPAIETERKRYGQTDRPSVSSATIYRHLMQAVSRFVFL